MLGLIPIVRMVSGSALILAGLIAIPLPVFPGIPIVLLGVSIGFAWHPKGLRFSRRMKVRVGRWWRRVSAKRGSGEVQKLGGQRAS
jgi:uncharacterized membrane protein